MRIIGVHPFGHDSCVVLMDSEKKTLRAFTLERFTRAKHDMRYVLPYLRERVFNFDPNHVALSSEECRPEDVKMFDSLQLIYETTAKQRKQRLSLADLTELFINKLRLRILVAKRKYQTKNQMADMARQDFKAQTVSLNDHHECHAYAALVGSEFWGQNNVLVITIDGQGDNACASISLSNNNKIQRKVTISNAFSLAILFSYFTEVAGFNPNADEGKLEALACYHQGGDPDLYEALDSWIIVNPSTLEFEFSPSKILPFSSIPGNRRRLISLLKNKYNKMPAEAFAYCMQKIFEEKYLEWIVAAKNKFKTNNLCLAGGGVANVKLNLRIFEEADFKGMYVFPAMGDDGVAFGAAVKSALSFGEDISFIRENNMPFYGETAKEVEVEDALNKAQEKGFRVSGPYTDKALSGLVAKAIGENNICAVFRGAAEFGPRALGHRSILANPSDPLARDNINIKFKKREWFQPFCPIMTLEEAEKILVSFYQNRHMTCAFRVKNEFADKIPSVVHVDNTARAEILERVDEPFIYDLLTELKSITGHAVLLNTSFNLHGRAMVNCPMHAINDFTDCGLDLMVLENHLIEKHQ